MPGSCVIEVGGSPSAIRNAAEWLRHKAESAANEADVIDGLIATTSYTYWQGRAGDAFNEVVGRMVAASREVADLAGPFAETLQVFAGKVERMQEKFEGFLAHAAAVGLRVADTTVFAPTWSGAVPQSDADVSWSEWRDYQKRLREYDRIQNDVVLWHGDHKAWIYTNLVGYAAGLPGEAQVQSLNDGIRTAAGLGFSAANRYLDVRWEQKVANLTFQAEGYAFLADEMSRKSYASGDPALRATLLKAIEDGTPEQFHSLAGKLSSVAEVTKSLRSVLDTVGGPVADIGLGAWAIADGKEPVDVLVEGAGGLGAVAISGWVAAGATVPVWAVGGAGLAGGVAVGAGWESTPASWRNGIYEFTEDGYIIVGDMGEQVGDWFVDRSLDIGQWLK
ncbi:hypothetical protein AB0O87_00370 [Microbacterium sp. NPDC076768]|uniref:hypothetical protein n=1 Tax=Microbacterium sp. NPDC076768 TaxID=3154858 RepID=UPI00342E3DCC